MPPSKYTYEESLTFIHHFLTKMLLMPLLGSLEQMQSYHFTPSSLLPHHHQCDERDQESLIRTTAELKPSLLLCVAVNL